MESGVGGVRGAGSIIIAGAGGVMGGKGRKRSECRLLWNEVDAGRQGITAVMKEVEAPLNTP